MNCDLPLCVVGAGPSGATAARLLAQSGCRRVILLEKCGWPRRKTCAGGLGPRAREWLDRQGLLKEASVAASRITSLRFTAPSGKSARLTMNREMAIVMPRDSLDAFLVSKAIAAGVDFRPSTEVTSVRQESGGVVVCTHGGDIEADAVVLAAGALNRAADKQPLRTGCAHSIMARFADFPHNPGEMEMIYSKNLSPYYAWLFPEPGGLVNVGLVAPSRRKGASLHDLFDDALENFFGWRPAGARQIGRRYGAPIRCPGRIGTVVDGRVLIAGESAGLVHCLTCEGIPYALESGELAASAIVRSITGGSRLDPLALRWYQRAVERRFWLPVTMSALYRWFVASPAFPPAAHLGTSPMFERFSAFVLAKA